MILQNHTQRFIDAAMEKFEKKCVFADAPKEIHAFTKLESADSKQ